MILIPIGELSQINRYPVKSFAGETLESSAIETYGLYGDRCHAFVDETKEGWDSFITARAIPKMLDYKAKLTNKPSNDEVFEVNITSPDGRSFSWGEDLLNELQPYSKRKMSMVSYNTQNSEGQMAVDAGSILIITDSSLRKLESIWGKRLDQRRFRANLILSLDEYSYNENNWIGKRLVVGEAELQVDLFCKRCSMITFDPDTLEKDISLLKKVNEEMQLHFGVYASVLKTGEINLGDKVYLVD